MNKKTYLFVCLILLVCQITWAQGTFQNYKFSSLGVNDGLSQSSVWDVLQTHDGFMWIGTSDGINRYDGYNFKVYKHEEGNPNSITGQNFEQLYEDKNHNLWASDDRGVSFYNKIKDSFENVYLLKKSPMLFMSNCFIGEDDNNGLIMFLADEIIVRIDINTHQITKTIALKKNNTSSMYDLLNKPIIFGKTAYFSINEYYLLELNLNELEPILYQYKTRLGKAIKHSENELLFVVSDTFTIFNINSKKTTQSLIKKGIIPPINFLPTSVNEYKGKYWFSSKTGMYVFDQKTMEFTQHIKGFSNSFSEEDNYTYVSSSYTDQSNNLWICTNGDGIKIFSPYKNKFEHYKTKSKKANLVKGICRTPNGLIFTTSYLQQIHVFDEKSGSYEELKLLDPNLFNYGTIVTIAPICNNRVAFVYKKSLYTYNYITKKTTIVIDEYKPPFSNNFFNGLNSYSSFLAVSPNELYLNIGGQILKLFFFPNGKFIFKSIFEDKGRICTSLQFDKNGKLWLGTMRGVIVVDTTTLLSHKLIEKSFVKCLLNASNNSMYVATQSGLYVFENYKQTDYYTTKNGLPADFTYGVLEDKKGNIWISHNKGLSCFDPKKKSFKNFTIHDGLQSSEFNTGAYYKDENGKLYFGGINGINVFNPDAIISNPHLPKVQFTTIKLFEEPLKTDSNVSVISQIKLPYFNNTLSFDFAALEFSNSQLNQYAYMLEGYDKDWIYSGNKHYSRYANLPFGNYVFKVKAANADEVWNEEPKKLTIVILPPFWRTYWFYILVVLLSITFIGLGLFYFLNQQKIKLKRRLEIQQKLEQERLRISRDLHDNVGAQLSYLITNVEWMLQHPNHINETEVQERLKALSETGRNAIITLRQTIWAISSTSLSIEDFTDRFKQFALKMIEFNSAIHVHFTEDFISNHTLSPAVALNLFRVCQEAFNNCLKHANCTEINIHFSSNNEQIFTFKITDNGKGFDWDEAKQKGHYGLVNMQARAKETNAELSFQSELGKGTTLLLYLNKPIGE